MKVVAINGNIKKNAVWKKAAWYVTACFILLVLMAWGAGRLVSFLDYNHPVDADILIVEGWLDSVYMKTVMTEFNTKGYSHLFVVGECDPSEQKKYGMCVTERSAQVLQQLGIEPSKITVVTVRPTVFHKTWSYALALRNYLDENNYKAKSANILSLWVHARKSFIIFQKALGPDIRVGAISAKHCRFSSEHWWLSMKGIYAVVKNGVAYLDALLFTGWGKKGTVSIR